MTQAEITPDLERVLRTLDAKAEVGLIAELRAAAAPPRPTESRQEGMARQRADFALILDAVSASIQRHGGRVLDASWLNRTLRLRIPAGRVRKLAELADVARLDVPHRLHLERPGTT